MNWILILAVLGIVVVGAYYLRSKGFNIPVLGGTGKVWAADPTIAGPTLLEPPKAVTAYVPPSRVASLVTPSTGPAISTRSGSGHF